MYKAMPCKANRSKVRRQSIIGWSTGPWHTLTSACSTIVSTHRERFLVKRQAMKWRTASLRSGRT